VVFQMMSGVAAPQAAPHATLAAERRVTYLLDDHIGVHASPEASLRKPHTVRLTDNLVVDCGLDKHMTMVRSGGDGWSPAPAATVRRYHTDAYVAFLEKIELHGKEVANEAANYVLNNSVCFSETAWPYAQIYAGASMHAAELLATGKADIAINWSGGQAHARRDCASGFSYVNDVVLAVLTLLQSVERVLFINVDSVHASGVEEAFYTTDRVMCVSLHRHGDGYFPGSGGAKDAGERAGKGHNINLPVERGFSDADLEALLPPVVEAAAARYQPAAVVLLAGTGLLSGDRLGCMNVTLGGYSKAVECVLALRRPTLLLGGGGYTTSIATRAWAAATSLACGAAPLPLAEHRRGHGSRAAESARFLASQLSLG